MRRMPELKTMNNRNTFTALAAAALLAGCSIIPSRPAFLSACWRAPLDAQALMADRPRSTDPKTEASAHASPAINP